MAVEHTVITLEQLLSRAGLASVSIDKECSDDHILKISLFLENWELVASFLSLKPPQIEEVKHDSNGDLKLMRLKALQKWKSLFVFNATYHVLLRALLINGFTDQALQVCRLLTPNQAVGVQNRPDVPTLEPYVPESIDQALVLSSSPRSAGASGEYNHGHQTIVDCSEKIVAGLSKEPKSVSVVLHGKGFISTETLREIVELRATKADHARKLYLSILETVQHHPDRYNDFIAILRSNTLLYCELLKELKETYLEKEEDAKNKLTRPILDHLQPADSDQSFVPSSPRSAGTTSAERVRCFESCFNKLRSSAFTEVKDIPVAHFRQSLTMLPNAISKQHEKYITEKYSVFMQANSVEYIFAHLNFYLSFIDFSLLEHIIEHFGSPGLQQSMEKYATDMVRFRSETTVADIIPHLSGRPDSPPDYVKLEMKLNFDPKTCTLEDLEQHRKRLGSEFSLSKFALFLVKLGEGSLVEVYLVPLNIVPTLKRHVQQKSLTFFLNLEILKLFVNEEHLYPFSTQKLGLASGASQPVSSQTEIDSQTSHSEQSTSSAGSNMASPVSINADKHRETLHGVILTAVHNKHAKAITQALEVLREHNLEKRNPKGSRSGKQVLDFLPLPNSAHIPKEYISHSPLMLACEEKNVAMVDFLLEQGASAAFKNKEGLNALHIACNIGHTYICDLLLKKAGSQNNFGKKKQYSTDLSILVNAKAKRGWTPLMYAVKGDHLKVVETLVATETVDFPVVNKKSSNFLHIACREGSTKCLSHLLTTPLPLIASELKSLFLATDKKGWNIFHRACSVKEDQSVGDHKCLLQWLIETIPDSILTDEEKSELVKQKTAVGYSPLLTACDYQNVKTVKYLAGRSDVDFSDFAEEILGEGDEERRGQRSGLHISAIHDSHEIAAILVEKGCKIDLKDLMGDTALHTAYRRSSEDVIALLEEIENGRLKEIRNLDEVLPKDIEPEDVIPPEIKKRGQAVVDHYRIALRHGKGKIPRCGLLILGEARKGKTSVYRLLVGKDFDPDQDPTRGIDNNEVDTVDSREISISWKERGEQDQLEERKHVYSSAIINELPDEDVKRKPDHQAQFEVKSEKGLLDVIDIVRAKIAKENTRRKPLIIKHSPIGFPFVGQSTSGLLDSPGQLPHTESVKSKPVKSSVVTTPNVEQRPAPVAEKKTGSESVKKVTKQPTTIPESSQKPKYPKHAPAPKKTHPPLLERQISTTRKEAKHINSALKDGKREKIEPSLQLNTLDFAGQKNYRPMHHCFITRRAMYLVVFNLQDMIEYVEQLEKSEPSAESGPNPVEEVRYWLHSIHAHIYPPDQPEESKAKDDRHRRVSLVGTHRNPRNGKRALTLQDLHKIEVKLREELEEDDRCVNHLRKTKPGCLFTAVENSRPRKDPNSGAMSLQDHLSSMTKSLDFLEEVYPVSWLRFETRLLKMGQATTQRGCVLESEVAEEAKRRGVIEESLDDALTFFHDTGKLILLRRVPTLFLGKEDAEKISNLVIVNPKWLISVMQIIMELPDNPNDKRFSPKEIKALKDRGEAKMSLLNRLWSESDKLSDAVDTEKLCLILQAYCLIYPVESESTQPSIGECDSLKGDDTTATSSDPCYLIPSLLPKCSEPARKKAAADHLNWMTFFFDFQKFLPLEIYHRLVCMLLDAFQTARTSRSCLFLSDTLCCFDNIDNCHWKVELESPQHRLKVSVKISSKDKSKNDCPSECIKKIHRDYLQKICQDSSLQGLRYYGGPLATCCCPQPRILEFVSYDVDLKDNKDGDDQKPECPVCLTTEKNGRTVDQLLSDQVKDPKSEASDASGTQKGAIGEYNHGHQTIVDCSEKIVAGLSKEPKSVAVALHGRGFISTETLSEVTELPATKADHARKLYLSILGTMRHHPHRYSEFISILCSNKLLYSDLLKVLKETYQEKEKVAKNKLTMPILDHPQPADSDQSFVSSSPRSAEQTIAINKELTVENVVEALKEAGYSNSNHSNLGWVLNVPVDKIKTFEENNPHDIAQVRIEIITHWMKNQPNKWSTIADAAEKLDIKNKAQEIRTYRKPPEKTASSAI